MPAARQTRELVHFYTLAFAISWAGYLPFFVLRSPSPIWLVALVLPGTGPALAAFATVGTLKHTSRSVWTWPVRFWLYLVAGLTPPLLLLLTRYLVPSRAPAISISQSLMIFGLDLAANPV